MVSGVRTVACQVELCKAPDKLSEPFWEFNPPLEVRGVKNTVAFYGFTILLSIGSVSSVYGLLVTEPEAVLDSIFPFPKRTVFL